MYNVKFLLKDTYGQLNLMGKTLGEHGISIEGGGSWTVDGVGQANFLFVDGYKAKSALESVGIQVLAVEKVLIQKLRQDIPGQLGLFTGRLAEQGVNINTLYSDHDNQLIVVVDDYEKGKAVSIAWMAEFWC